jgi:hypothetical protein
MPVRFGLHLLSSGFDHLVSLLLSLQSLHSLLVHGLRHLLISRLLLLGRALVLDGLYLSLYTMCQYLLV